MSEIEGVNYEKLSSAYRSMIAAESGCGFRQLDLGGWGIIFPGFDLLMRSDTADATGDSK